MLISVKVGQSNLTWKCTIQPYWRKRADEGGGRWGERFFISFSRSGWVLGAGQSTFILFEGGEGRGALVLFIHFLLLLYFLQLFLFFFVIFSNSWRGMGGIFFSLFFQKNLLFKGEERGFFYFFHFLLLFYYLKVFYYFSLFLKGKGGMGFFFLFFYSWREEVGVGFTFSFFVNFFYS